MVSPTSYPSGGADAADRDRQHSGARVTNRLANMVIRALLRCLCRVDDAQLASVPARGPLILVTNHVNFLEVPLLATHLQPRPVTGFAKVETWESPLLAPLANLWDAIPLHRGEADVGAFRQALAALRASRIVVVAPEGTRSGDGRLQRGHPGVVFLALHSGAPILPLAHYGGERFWSNLRKLRRTAFHIRVGEAFRLEPGHGPVTQGVRRQMVDEIMACIAALLPPPYRGVYAAAPPATHLRQTALGEQG